MTTDEHRWSIESSHRISTGRVEYQACPCGARRIVSFDERALAVANVE